MVFKPKSSAIYVFSSLLFTFGLGYQEAQAHMSFDYHDHHSPLSEENDNSSQEVLNTNTPLATTTADSSENIWTGVDRAGFLEITGIEDFVTPSPETNYETLAIGARAELEENSELLTFIETAETTDGEYTLALVTQPSLAGTPLHIHDEEDEWFYITQGQYQFQIEDETVQVNPGDLVFAAAGVLHNFVNVGNTRGEMYIIWEPGGVEDFFRETSIESLTSSPVPDEIQIAEAASKAGITLFFDDPTPPIFEPSGLLGILAVSFVGTVSILKRKSNHP